MIDEIIWQLSRESQLIPINIKDMEYLYEESVILKRRFFSIEEGRDRRMDSIVRVIKKYADKWDWEVIIDSYGHDIFSKKAIEFYEKYKDYIPVSKLQSTTLWQNIIEQRAHQLACEITAEDY